MTDKNAIELLDKFAQSVGYTSFIAYGINNAFYAAFMLGIVRYDFLCDSSNKLEITGSYVDFSRQLYKMLNDGHELHVGSLCISRDDGCAMQFMIEYELLAAV